ncbi:MAG TPA: LysM peptidoglycan-binding domain-containing protein, partial [Actinomycetales bacterium]|nr:LysM peptidoglycan-binding domain-containing protein [Actinomycetales bacterium]
MKVLKSLGALLVLALLLVGVPIALTIVGGSPVPSDLPSQVEIASMLANPNWSVLLGGLLKYVGWFAWLTFAVSVAVAIPAAVKGVKAPRLPGFGVQQRLAATLLGAIVFTAVPQMAFAAPAGEATAVDTTISQALFTPQGPGAAKDSSQEAVKSAAHPGTYTVQSGDSLYAMAAKFLGDGERWPEIAQLNYGRTQADGSALGASNQLETGWVLELPTDAVDPELAGTRTIQHDVVEGDTLWDLAERYLGDP